MQRVLADRRRDRNHQLLAELCGELGHQCLYLFDGRWVQLEIDLQLFQRVGSGLDALDLGRNGLQLLLGGGLLDAIGGQLDTPQGLDESLESVGVLAGGGQVLQHL
ncbi:hypothetical protein D3C78_1146660 [compost metagenome]